MYPSNLEERSRQWLKIHFLSGLWNFCTGVRMSKEVPMSPIAAANNSSSVLGELLLHTFDQMMEQQKKLLQVTVEMKEKEQEMKNVEDIINTYIQ